MNYIKKLEDENRKLKEALEEAKRGMRNLESYCFSEKYWNDPYVNNKDVALRLSETFMNISRVEP